MPVVNMRRYEAKPGDIYVGRAGHGFAGYFGNPIRPGVECPICTLQHVRGSTLPCFEKWARRRLEQDEVYRQKVKRLYGRTLLCFCKPNPCHGDILEVLAMELNMGDDTGPPLI